MGVRSIKKLTYFTMVIIYDIIKFRAGFELVAGFEPCFMQVRKVPVTWCSGSESFSEYFFFNFRNSFVFYSA